MGLDDDPAVADGAPEDRVALLGRQLGQLVHAREERGADLLAARRRARRPGGGAGGGGLGAEGAHLCLLGGELGEERLGVVHAREQAAHPRDAGRGLAEPALGVLRAGRLGERGERVGERVRDRGLGEEGTERGLAGPA